MSMAEAIDKEYFFLRIVKKSLVQTTFVVLTTQLELNKIQSIVISTGRDIEWVVLSRILKDRRDAVNRFCDSLDSSVWPPNTELSIDQVVASVIQKGFMDKSIISDRLKEYVAEACNRACREEEEEEQEVFSATQGCDQPGRLARGGPKITSVDDSMEDVGAESGIKQMLEEVMKGVSSILALGNETKMRVEALRNELEGITSTQVKMGKDIAMLAQEEPKRKKVPRCSFCQVDDHRLVECQEKFECIRCGKNCHKISDCPFREDFKCRWCNAEGHAALLHQAVDPAFKHKIIAEYGNENFLYFWATDPPREARGPRAKEKLKDNRSSSVGAQNVGRDLQQHGFGRGWGRKFGQSRGGRF